MHPYSLIFFSLLGVSLVSFAGAGMLAFNDHILRRMLIYLVGFSTGAMLGNVFVHLLPELLTETTNIPAALLTVLGGMLISFIIEKFVHWHHCHVPHHHCEGEDHVHPIGPLVIAGDAVHNLLDGILIASSFLVDPSVGLATTVAVVLHEVPQEISDFALLLHSGFSRKRALMFNFLSALTAFLGAGLVLLAADAVEGIELWMLAIAAGNFLYIAGSDLIPELHKQTNLRQSFVQLLLIAAGIGLMWTVSTEHAHEEGEHAEDLHIEEAAGF